MNKYKYLLFVVLGIAVIASLIFVFNQPEAPTSLKPDTSVSLEPAQSLEDALVSEVLADTEAFAEAEDAAILEASVSEVPPSVPLPVSGSPLPVAWESKPAPNMDEVELSPALQRSLAASAPLRTEAYMNPSSDFNLERVESLREIRQRRQPKQ